MAYRRKQPISATREKTHPGSKKNGESELAKIGCPFCNKVGITMVITGLAFVIGSGILTLPWLAIIGLVILLAAYIVPNMLSGDSCHTSGPSRPTQNSGEEPRNE
ncbi:MAG: hypothetical protein ACFE89_04070 [Candidatus Hodarchaeota archaeon]